MKTRGYVVAISRVYRVYARAVDFETHTGGGTARSGFLSR